MSPVRRVPLWRGPAAAVLGGVLAAVLGTGLHAQILYVGDAAVPLGAVAALVLSCAVAVFAGVWAGAALWTAAAGLVAYVVLGLFTLDIWDTPLIITGTVLDEQPGIVLAGRIWLFGQALVTIAALLLTARVLAKARRFEAERAADQQMPQSPDLR
ncbi:hypothetical protein QNO00_05035 [Arthrobacter sp. zg-Y1219]|uniref:hypothetical protein n=1 Tax=Arthrobacter sp. zg-Y1219 TaxID=3049067 RepID=UPI0024C32B7F|nr:hypothetical protein [Arthrobacter sp. zg-Y1219]MDK1359629.1 hypothetical protein [Arthrobacter sp. zg-Y1219]